MKNRVFLCVVFAVLAGCTSAPFAVKPRVPVPELQTGTQRIFRIRVAYFNQDDSGLTSSIDQIDARVLRADAGDLTYYKWTDYRVRSFPVGPSAEDRMERVPSSNTPWEDYVPAIGYEYALNGLIADENAALSNLPNMDSIPRDLTGFKFYTNVIDFHTWDIYAQMFLSSREAQPARIQQPGDVSLFPMPKGPIPLLTWQGVSSDLRFEGGYAEARYLCDTNLRGEPVRLLSLEQNQRLTQTVYGMVGTVQMKMPYQGTSRLVAHMYFGSDNQIRRAEFSEYVYSKITVPVLIAVIVHTKRDYVIERE